MAVHNGAMVGLDAQPADLRKEGPAEPVSPEQDGGRRRRAGEDRPRHVRLCFGRCRRQLLLECFLLARRHALHGAVKE